MARRGIRVELVGETELRAKIHQLGENVRKANSRAARAAEVPILNEANTNAPGPNIFALQSKLESTDDIAVIDIGPDKDHWYYQFTETGATAHEIKGNPLVFEGEKGLVVTGKVKHPGMDAHPFLRPAMNHNRDEAQRIAGEVFRREIDSLLENRGD